MALLIICFTLLITTTTSQNTSIPEISETFQNLVTHTHSQNAYLKFLSSVEQVTREAPGTNDIKKLYNLMSAAAVSKILTNLAKHQQVDQPVAEIKNNIKSLETNTITLPHYISSHTSHLKTQLSQNLNNTDLIPKLAHLKSSLESQTNSTPAPLQKEPQLATISLLQIYVCSTNPTQRYVDINSNFQVPPSLRFIDIPKTPKSPNQFTWPSPTCQESLQDYQLRRFSHVAHSPIIGQLISKYNDRTGNLQQAHSKFRKVAKDPQNTYENLIDYFKAASQLEQSVDSLVTQLCVETNSPDVEGFLLQASLYELSDAEKAKKLEKAELDKVKVHFKALRYLRSRLYDSIISIFEESLDILNGNVNDGVSNEDIITDTLSAIKDSTPSDDHIDNSIVQSANTHRSTLNQLKYYQHFNQLSDLMTNLNSPFGSKTEIHEPHVKALATLSDQVIKSSLLQIEYGTLSKALAKVSSDVTRQDTRSRLKSYTFVLSESNCSPDNYVQTCFLINGQHPGPPIIVNQHDMLRVHVINRLSVNTTIHFHGLLQRHTVESDGVGGVTQEPIPPNGSYVYEIQVGDQPAGTYMYHGHHNLDLVWIHGPLIVRDNTHVWENLGPEYYYNHEHTFMLESVFHDSLDQVIAGIVEQGIDDPPVDSFAINGRSYGNWSSNNGDSSGYEVVNVKLGKIYRFRVINISAGSMLLFTIDNHTFTIVEMDGIVTEPVVTDRLEIHSGQRYSVLVTMDQVPGNYWVRSRVMGDEGGADNGRAVIHYERGGDVEGMRTRVFDGVTDAVEISGDGWVLGELMPVRRVKQVGVYDFPGESDRRVLIDMQMRTVGGPPRFLVNGEVFVEPNGTFLGIVRGGGDLDGESHVVKVKGGEVVDLVFQNRVDDTGGCDEHPIHTHGHSFWVVTTGADLVNMTELEDTLKVEGMRGNKREFRDTWTLFPNSSVESSVSGTACGWGVLRFVADNPGMWLVHCHVTSHMILGKQFVLYEYVDGNEGLFNE